MKPLMAWAAMLLLALPSVCRADNESAASSRQSADPELSVIAARGTMLYLFDQAAWHSSDILVEKAGDPGKLPLAGRVVVPVRDGLEAIYYGKNAKGRFIILSAQMRNGKFEDIQFIGDGSGPPLSAEANRFADILEKWMSGELGGEKHWFCNKANPNFVLLPGSKQDHFSLYLMTPQIDRNVFPFGGHHRIDIANGEIASERTFSKSCLDFDMSNAPTQEPMMFVNHLLDALPTEVHVFTALAAQVPVVVMTAANDKSWLIQPRKTSVVISELDIPERK